MDPFGQMYQREYYIAVMTDHEEYRELGDTYYVVDDFRLGINIELEAGIQKDWTNPWIS